MSVDEEARGSSRTFYANFSPASLGDPPSGRFSSGGNGKRQQEARGSPRTRTP